MAEEKKMKARKTKYPIWKREKLIQEVKKDICFVYSKWEENNFYIEEKKIK